LPPPPSHALPAFLLFTPRSSPPSPPPSQGEENLPQGPCVIVSNHGSFLDPSLCAVALSSVNFKCTFKHDLMYIPGIGSSLWFAGHIPVNRKLKEGGLWSCRDAMAASRSWAERGIALLTFAEGTRTTSTTAGAGVRLGEFKPGPFATAQRAQVPIVPLTLSGARSIFPPGGLPQLGFGEVLITIHPPVPPPALCAHSEEAARAAVVAVRDAVRATVDSALRSPLDDLPLEKGGAAEEKKER
jgi:1-acyl-sn-glycerol-3-phosphate acyltransferase